MSEENALEQSRSLPVVLTFTDLSVSTEGDDKNAKTVLKKVSGVVSPGLTAVMGPTASGKSSFLNALVGHLPAGLRVSSGDIRINGKQFTSQEVHFGHCLQVDELNGRLTVMETLMYAAELVLFHQSRELQLARVEELLRDLGIFHVKDVLVGSPLKKGISGGQRKRLSIALSMLSKPPLLLLDEPTAGLDSVTAMQLVALLKRIATEQQVAVLCVIHQPQRAIFELLDRLILLRTGEIIYNGVASECIPFMESLGYEYDGVSNPADHIMEVISPQLGETLTQLEARCAVRKNYKPQVVDHEQNAHIPLPAPHATSARLHQFSTLLRRQTLQELRDVNLHLLNFFIAATCSFLIGAVWYQLKPLSSSVSKRSSAIFFCIINQSLFGALKSILSFPEQRTMMLRERKAKLYSTLPAFASWMLVDMMQIIVWSMVYAIIAYSMVGFRSGADHFFIFFVFVSLDKIIASSIACMICSFTSSISVPTTVLPVILELSRLFGGFFLPPALLPTYFSWLDALSYIKYAYVGAVLNELDGHVFDDSATAGSSFIAKNGLNYISVGGCVGVLIAVIVFTQSVTYTFLLKKKR